MSKQQLPKVFIVGESGTTGLRLQERLSARSDLTLLLLPEEKRKDHATIRAYAQEADLMFLCLPDDAAREIVEVTAGTDIRILDTSTAHRTQDDWVYGFPELSDAQTKAIASAEKVAVPGCHASGAIALLYPLVKAGVLPSDYPLHIISLTGYSGGGKKMIQEYEHEKTTPLSSPRQYGLLQKHKHLPEIQKVCGLFEKPLFSPIVSDFYSGMEVTIGLHTNRLSVPGMTPDAIRELYRKHYADSKLVTVAPFSTEETNKLYLAANTHSGKDSLMIYVSGNEERLEVISVFDNLGKGASGAAVECMNLMLGLPAETGLVL